MEVFYPKWIYHKTLGGKIVNSKEDHDAQGPGWEETPAAFDKEPAKAPEKPAADQEKAGTIKETDFTKLKVAELKELLISKGVDAEELEGLKKDELIAKVGEL